MSSTTLTVFYTHFLSFLICLLSHLIPRDCDCLKTTVFLYPAISSTNLISMTSISIAHLHGHFILSCSCDAFTFCSAQAYLMIRKCLTCCCFLFDFVIVFFNLFCFCSTFLFHLSESQYHTNFSYLNRLIILKVFFLEWYHILNHQNCLPKIIHLLKFQTSY